MNFNGIRSQDMNCNELHQDPVK